MKSDGGPATSPVREEPTEHRIRVSGAELAFFEWGSPHRAAGSILLAHATGFHARCWDNVVARLGPRHIISVDQRGHGRSEKVEITEWGAFGQDLAELVQMLDLRCVVGVGHSMGGHAMVDAAALASGHFERLLLIDPVIASPDAYREGGWAVPGAGELHPTAKRKNHFESSAEMIERFHDRHPYSLFEPAALRDYCRFGLVPAPDGDGFVLGCPPSTEASIYMTSRTNPGIHERARSLELPVTILRAPPADSRDMMDFAASPTWPELVHEFQNGEDILVSHLSHFIPMQAPGLVAELILRDPVVG